MVIAVIGILAALLLPALVRARDRAKETVCLGNFRQIGIGLKLYQGDNNDRYPLGATLISNPGALVPRGTPQQQIWSFTAALGGKDGKEPLPMQQMLPPAKARPLNRYVTEPRSFQCPADGGVDYRANGGPQWDSLWESFGCSYHYNAPGRGEDSLYRTRISGKQDDWLSQPSRFIVLYEPPANRHIWNNIGHYVYWHRSHPPKTLDNPRLGTADGRLISPILFADGHAEIVDFTGRADEENTSSFVWYQPE